MTRSQLNLAIMDMLNLSQSTHGCDYVCRGKSMSEAFKTISRSGYLTHFQRIEHDLKKKNNPLYMYVWTIEKYKYTSIICYM